MARRAGARGSRKVPFGQELIIERDDFAEEPSGWKRLAPGREVRLAGGYVVRCEGWSATQPARSARSAARSRLSAAASGGRWRGRSTGCTRRARRRRTCGSSTDSSRSSSRTQPDFLAALNPRSLVVAEGAGGAGARRGRAGTRWQFLRQATSSWIRSTRGRARRRSTGPSRSRTRGRGRRLERGPRRRKKDARATAPRAAPTREAPAGAEARRSRAEQRAEARASRPELAARYARYTGRSRSRRRTTPTSCRATHRSRRTSTPRSRSTERALCGAGS